MRRAPPPTAPTPAEIQLQIMQDVQQAQQATYTQISKLTEQVSKVCTAVELMQQMLATHDRRFDKTEQRIDIMEDRERQRETEQRNHTFVWGTNAVSWGVLIAATIIGSIISILVMHLKF